MVEDFEDFEKMDVSEIHARRLNAKEVLTPMKGEKFIIRIADGTVKLSGGISGSENIHLNPGSPRRRRRTRQTFQENQTALLQPHFKTHRCMIVKQEMISAPFQAILFTVIMRKPESNCTCREKRHSQFH